MFYYGMQHCNALYNILEGFFFLLSNTKHLTHLVWIYFLSINYSHLVQTHRKEKHPQDTLL